MLETMIGVLASICMSMYVCVYEREREKNGRNSCVCTVCVCGRVCVCARVCVCVPKHGNDGRGGG